MPRITLPTNPEEFTPAWMTEALASGGHLGDARVTGVTPASVGEGFGLLGSLARLSLAYDRDDPALPRTLVAKFPALAEVNREIARQYQVYVREVRFYQEIQDTIAMPTPRAFFAEYDPDTNDGVILLEDLAATNRIGDQLVPPERGELGPLVDMLADLHAAWWGTAETPAVDWVPKFNAPVWQQVSGTMQGFWPTYQTGFGHMLTGELRDVIERVWANLPWLLERLAEPPITLVHTDYRADNMFFPADGDGSLTIHRLAAALARPGPIRRRLLHQPEPPPRRPARSRARPPAALPRRPRCSGRTRLQLRRLLRGLPDRGALVPRLPHLHGWGHRAGERARYPARDGGLPPQLHDDPRSRRGIAAAGLANPPRARAGRALRCWRRRAPRPPRARGTPR